MLYLVQAVTFDVWTETMYDVMLAYSPAAWPYFIAVALLGGLVVVNLALAVIFDEFIRNHQSLVDDAAAKVSAGRGPHDGATVTLDAPPTPSASAAGADEDNRVDGGSPLGGLSTDALLPASQARSDGISVALDEQQQASMRYVYDGDSSLLERGCCAGCGSCECAPPAGGWRDRLRITMISPTVSNVSTFLVLFNLLLMCLPYAQQPEWWSEALEQGEAYVTYAFMVEMGLKLLGQGCASYWSDRWNVLDGLIVLVSSTEMTVTILLDTDSLHLSAFRLLRLLRLLKLLRAWPGLLHVVESFGRAIPQIGNLTLLLLLMLLVFALLGMVCAPPSALALRVSLLLHACMRAPRV